MNAPLIIATRPSKLALWQANHVMDLLLSCGRDAELKEITTKGDRILDRSLVDIGGKGLFLKEIEDALLDGSADLAVHSMKDVPYDLDPRLVMAALLPREDSSDAYISNHYPTPAALPANACVGTTSLRRMVQLKLTHPNLKFQTLRGNVDTRLRKLDDEQFDAIILASAGLKRLGMGARITQTLDIVPSGGQGAIGIECRSDRADLQKLLAPFNDFETARCVMLERSFLRRVQGSCQTPTGCRVVSDTADTFIMTYFLADADGSRARRLELKGKWSEAEALVAHLAVD